MQEIRIKIFDKSGIDVLSKSRKTPIPTAKKIFVKIARSYCEKPTYKKISSFLNLDHSTVIYHEKTNLIYEIKPFPVLCEIYKEYFFLDYKSKEELLFEIENLKKENKRLKDLLGIE